MLRSEFESAVETDPEALRAVCDDLLVAAIERVGRDEVADATGIDGSTLDALLAGESPSLSLSEAAAVLATDTDRPGADAILAEARDILLMGMSTAVLDVEALASAIDDKMEPKEIQQKVEGRHPMTLEEYVLLYATIEAKK